MQVEGRARSTNIQTGSRLNDEIREELVSLAAGTGFEPERARGADACALLDRDGAVIINGLPPDPDSMVLAAAEVLGTRLSRVYPVRQRGGDHGAQIQLHNDSHHIVLDVHGRLTQLRDPDEDYVLLQILRPATDGGDSLVVDGYRVVDAIRDAYPALWDFLTTVDVDFYGGFESFRGVPTTRRDVNSVG